MKKLQKFLIRDFGEIEKLQVSKKGPNDFVTNADLKTEKIILDELRKAKPNYTIISEENGIEMNKDKRNSWIVDPIDGTVNFLHGIPHFAISIAHMTEGEIVSGITFDPIKNEIFYAEKIMVLSLIIKELEFQKKIILMNVYLLQVII